MYRSNARIARQARRRADCRVVPFRDPHMHRNRIRTTVGVTVSLIAIFPLLPLPHRLAESDTQRREGSP
jgi:hypothetical protein